MKIDLNDKNETKYDGKAKVVYGYIKLDEKKQMYTVETDNKERPDLVRKGFTLHMYTRDK